MHALRTLPAIAHCSHTELLATMHFVLFGLRCARKPSRTERNDNSSKQTADLCKLCMGPIVCTGAALKRVLQKLVQQSVKAGSQLNRAAGRSWADATPASHAQQPDETNAVTNNKIPTQAPSLAPSQKGCSGSLRPCWQADKPIVDPVAHSQLALPQHTKQQQE
jgi:hypothetical protein